MSLRLPGLCNAHVHLELGPLARPAERGFLPWLDQVQANAGSYVGGDPAPFLHRAGGNWADARRYGTTQAFDISNTGLTAKLSGVTCFHEKLGIDRPEHTVADGARPIPHAVYSTHPAWIQQCARAPGLWSIHCDEDPAEAEFLHGTGPWPARLAAFGRDLSRFDYPRCTPVRYLDALGAMNAQTLLVHCIETATTDLDIIAERGANVVLCPRSNLWIAGKLPDVRAMLDREIPLWIGTDSLASCPDLDLLEDLVVLHRAFPDIAPARWASMAFRDPSHTVIFPDVHSLDQLLDGTRWPRVVEAA